MRIWIFCKLFNDKVEVEQKTDARIGSHFEILFAIRYAL